MAVNGADKVIRRSNEVLKLNAKFIVYLWNMNDVFNTVQFTHSINVVCMGGGWFYVRVSACVLSRVIRNCAFTRHKKLCIPFPLNMCYHFMTSECYVGNGIDYRGTVHRTEAGTMCHSWENASAINPSTHPGKVSYTSRKCDPLYLKAYPDSKVHGANMGPAWGRQDLGGPHVGPMNLAI